MFQKLDSEKLHHSKSSHKPSPSLMEDQDLEDSEEVSAEEDMMVLVDSDSAVEDSLEEVFSEEVSEETPTAEDTVTPTAEDTVVTVVDVDTVDTVVDSTECSHIKVGRVDTPSPCLGLTLAGQSKVIYAYAVQIPNQAISLSSITHTSTSLRYKQNFFLHTI